MISLTAANGYLVTGEAIERNAQHWDDFTKAINAEQGATQLTVDLRWANPVSCASLLRSQTNCYLQDPTLKVVFDNVLDLDAILNTGGGRFRKTETLQINFVQMHGRYSRKIYGFKLADSFPNLKTLLVTVPPENSVLIALLGSWAEQPSCIVNGQLQSAPHGHIKFDNFR